MPVFAFDGDCNALLGGPATAFVLYPLFEIGGARRGIFIEFDDTHEEEKFRRLRSHHDPNGMIKLPCRLHGWALSR